MIGWHAQAVADSSSKETAGEMAQHRKGKVVFKCFGVHEVLEKHYLAYAHVRLVGGNLDETMGIVSIVKV